MGWECGVTGRTSLRVPVFQEKLRDLRTCGFEVTNLAVTWEDPRHLKQFNEFYSAAIEGARDSDSEAGGSSRCWPAGWTRRSMK